MAMWSAVAPYLVKQVVSVSRMVHPSVEQTSSPVTHVFSMFLSWAAVRNSFDADPFPMRWTELFLIPESVPVSLTNVRVPFLFLHFLRPLRLVVAFCDLCQKLVQFDCGGSVGWYSRGDPAKLRVLVDQVGVCCLQRLLWVVSSVVCGFRLGEGSYGVVSELFRVFLCVFSNVKGQ